MSIDQTGQDGTVSSGRRLLRVILLLLLAVMLAGAIAGFLGAHAEGGGGPLSTTATIAFAVILLLGLASLVQIYRDLRGLFGDMDKMPRAERVSVQFLAVSMILGMIGGAATVLLQSGTEWLEPGNRSMPPALAISATVFLLTIGPWASWRWWRAIDEHERAAYVDGANAAGHFALFGGIAWWLLARAALVPDPDAMILVIVMSIIWSAVWLYRKFS